MGGCWSCLREFLDGAPPMNPHAVDLTHFHLHRVLGRGGFGKVQVAESRVTGELFALKQMSKHWLLENMNNCRTVWMERQILTTLRSPFLVHAHYAFADAQNVYLVMQFVPGGDLHYLLQGGHTSGRRVRDPGSIKPLPESHVKFYVAEIILGLEELHSHGFVYR